MSADLSPAPSDDVIKTGRYTREECQFIADNVYHLNYLDIAKKLNRSPDGVKNYIETKLGLKTSLKDSHKPVTKSEYIYDLENDGLWLSLQQQFTIKELQEFRRLWNEFFEQFGGDVLPTEKLQIIDTIKLQLLMDANLEERKRLIEEMQEIKDHLDTERQKEEDARDRQQENEMNKMLNLIMTNQQTLNKDYKELQDRKDKMFRALKGTRQQRIERISSSKENFTNWMQEIIENPKKRKELGERMEKMRLSMIDEEVRLAAYHKYEDGVVDQPLLTSQTVKEDNGRMNVLEQESAEEKV